MKTPIRIFDLDFNLLAEIDGYESLIFTRRFRRYGEFQIVINFNLENAEYLQRDNLILVGNEYDRFGIIKHREINLDQAGQQNERLTIIGYTLDYLFNQRLTVATVEDAITGDFESVMKHYVDNHVANPTDVDRTIDIFTIATNQNRGTSIDWSSRYERVTDVLYEISEFTDYGFEVLYNTTDAQFEIIPNEDKTTTSGNPVLFSTDYDNIESQNLVDTDIDHRNVAYVGGSGEGATRPIEEVGTDTGIDRKEIFVNANSDVSAELVNEGEQELSKYKERLTLQARILNTQLFKYRVDWNLGTKVTVVNSKWGIQKDSLITEVTEIWELNNYDIEVIFDDKATTFTDAIKNEMQNFEKEVTK